MRHKTDIALAATTARSYNRRWRAKKLSWADIGKIKYLFDGAAEFIDEVTLAYTQVHFNKLRTALGFKQDSELVELVERAEAFRIVRNTDTGQVEAFMSPLVGGRFEPAPNQVIEEPAIDYELFDCKANALANDSDRDKISENQRKHKKRVDMKVLLAGNVPKFHITPSDEAVTRIHDMLIEALYDIDLRIRYYEEFLNFYANKYKVEWPEPIEALELFINEKLIGHMASRVGIENWPEEAIWSWLSYYFAYKQFSKVSAEVHEVWLRNH